MQVADFDWIGSGVAHPRLKLQLPSSLQRTTASVRRQERLLNARKLRLRTASGADEEMKESMAIRTTLCFALVLSLAVACSTQEHYRTKSLMKLQLGMSKQEVLSIMGSPQRQESYGDTEVLFYTTDEFGDRKETDTPLTITRGRLVGWGRLDYERVVRAHQAMPNERLGY